MDGLKKLKEKHRALVRFGTLERDTSWTACLLIGRVAATLWVPGADPGFQPLTVISQRCLITPTHRGRGYCEGR